MKIFIAIIIIYFIAPMPFRAEEIMHKDFEHFFIEFQKDLMEYKGLNAPIASRMDYSTIKNYYLHSDKNKFEEFITILLLFSSAVSKEYEDICSLSSNNNYEYREGNSKIWSIQYINKYQNLPEPVYALRRYYNLAGKKYQGSFGCIFYKVDGKWKIIGISQKQDL